MASIEEKKKVIPFVIDNLLGAPLYNRVARVGVELEGGWKVVPEGARLEVDTSVFKGQTISGHKTGELPIGPFQPGALGRAMRKYYPQKVDATCGMHVHMSFETSWLYSLLTVPEYQATIVHYLSKWAEKEGFIPSHHIWERLSGKSSYCQDQFWPDEQIRSKKDHDQARKGHRYTIVNYCGRQATIEVRVLPMMLEWEQAVRAVRQVIAITNASLLMADKNRRPVKGKLELPNGETYYESLVEPL